jgi:hypothetical protein
LNLALLGIKILPNFDSEKQLIERWIFPSSSYPRDTMLDYDEGVLNKMEKGWAIATRCSEQRLKRIYEWTDAELNTAIREGMVMLETVCVFVHGCIKSGQYKCAKLPFHSLDTVC